jgi:hypothetical protein
VRALASIPLLGGLLLAGCGGEEPPPRTPAPVSLEIAAPGDATVVRDDGVEIRGRVDPATARVLVRGRRAAVSGGQFSATVALREGANVIDVAASTRAGGAAWRAVRVTRRVTIPVPDVVGRPLEEAEARVEAAGLRPEPDKGGGLIEAIMPGPWVVCETSPAAGAEVRREAKVRLASLKGC